MNFKEKLRAIVGAEHVLDSGDLSSYELDWKRYLHGKALAVALPGNTREVAEIVRLCAKTGTPIVPQGGNTGFAVGGVPDESGTQLLLNLKRMNQVRAVDAANLSMTVEAGCILQNLQTTAKEAGFLFPLSLGAEGSCMIGGNLATNAGGTQVVRYGNTRELCLGLEVVTAQGEIWNGLSGLRKDNTGYSLRDLFIGSEGTLGIITAATLKLYPQPAAQLTAWAAVPSMQAAVDLLGMAHKHLGAGLTGFEVMNQFALGLVARHYPHMNVPLWQEAPFCVLLENSDHESEEHARAIFETLLEQAFEAEVVSDAVIAESLAQAEQLWHIRESITLAQAEEGFTIKYDISVPIAKIPAFVEASGQSLERELPDVQLCNFGHLGDGNLHYNLQAAPGDEAARQLKSREKQLNRLIFDAVTQFEGSISAEHGIGSLKVQELPHYKSAVALDLMRAIKRALDPQGIMNPGRVLQLGD